MMCGHYIVFWLILSVLFVLSNGGHVHKVFSDSPSFSSQEINTSTQTLESLALNKSSPTAMSKECTEGSYDTPPVEIEAVDYLSDGKTLNATVWLPTFFYDPANSFLSKGKLDVTVGRFQPGSRIDIDDTLNIRNQSLDGLNPISVTNTTTSGKLPLITINYVYEFAGNIIGVSESFIVMGDLLYHFHYSAPEDVFESDSEDLQKIMHSVQIGSTFSSLKSNSTDGLLVYQNSEYRIKMQYPQDWIKIENGRGTNNILSFISSSSSTTPSPWRIIDYAMLIDVNSIYDTGIDYSVDIIWDGKNWTRRVSEYSSSLDSKILEETDNFTGFFDNGNRGGKGYIDFYFDLKRANFPSQYNLVFSTFAEFSRDSYNCMVGIVTPWVSAPPPEFTIFTTETDSTVLRPSEERNIPLQIKSNTNLESQVAFSTDKNILSDLEATFIPEVTSIIPDSVTSSNLNIKALANAKAKSYNIPVNAKISFPRETDFSVMNQQIAFNNTVISDVFTSANLTVTVLPPLSIVDYLNSLNALGATIKDLITWLTVLASGIGGGFIIYRRIVSKFRRKHETGKFEAGWE